MLSIDIYNNGSYDKRERQLTFFSRLGVGMCSATTLIYAEASKDGTQCFGEFKS